MLALACKVAHSDPMDSWLSPDWTAVQVSPTALALEELSSRAQARHERMNGDALAYGTTSEEMNIVGLMGEYAVTHWLEEQGVDVASIGDDPKFIASGQGDVRLTFTPDRWTQVKGLVEVKTSRRTDYLRLERTVVRAQLSRMSCDAVFWCTVADDLAATAVVDIMGWLTLAEAQASESHELTVARGRQAVKVKHPLRDPRGFLAWLEAEAKTRPPF